MNKDITQTLTIIIAIVMAVWVIRGDLADNAASIAANANAIQANANAIQANTAAIAEMRADIAEIRAAIAEMRGALLAHINSHGGFAVTDAVTDISDKE